ncbi:hypothetical protein [Mangrovibrevibacter kandeliae]|uniref:hypothetical protein n=1 Tax=Mangrovibrevibacter kandeliae TaxID=2968473 RepID=UPI0021189C6D|nr:MULTISPECIES: hypothetical protein [unclassified Aurantimonas]MCQ8784099.1 hypothetical protein [Aurantimonas sp. CSK15Z-1]MCW4116818.1 hypothetical protein [Aurantimonas sp. MSK8Z-1]
MNAKPMWMDAVAVYSAPTVEARVETPKAPAGSLGPQMLMVASGACLAASVTAVVMLFLAWRPLHELREIDGRLATLDGIEKRLGDHVTGQLDRVDTGLRIRIDRMDDHIGGLSQTLGALRSSVDDSVGILQDTSARMDESLSAAIVTMAEVGQPDPTHTASIAAPAASDAAPEPDTAPRFERRELPNGSVAYRKVR